jgi:phospholipid/cholesterol/gamma-HCH transport system permease protein
MRPDSTIVTGSWSERGTLTLAFKGSLTGPTAGLAWKQAGELLGKKRPPLLIIDASGLDSVDEAGLSILVDLCRQQRTQDSDCRIEGLSPECQHLLSQYDPYEKPVPQAVPPKLQLPEEIGRVTVHLWDDMKEQIIFMGQLTAALGNVLRHPSRLRAKDMWSVMETAGTNALPIIALIGFLLGLILAFQSAMPMRTFGAEIFVANLVSLSLFRELGPLITAIILTARTGSAFAAELGTMKVNEEIDALTTMGLDPVRFLVVTRVLGAVIVTPLLTIFANLFGLIGAGVVMLSLGFPLVTYVQQVMSSVSIGDLLGGLFKAFAFGIMVSAVGCQRGLQTKSGASAVGESTTRSVVSGIIWIVIADGIFSVLFYSLGI